MSLAWLVPQLPDECPPEDPELGGLFLSLRQHAIEGVVVTAVVAWLYTSMVSRQSLVPVARAHTDDRGILNRVFEFVVLLRSVSTLCFVFYHKHMESRMLYLLQPCHVFNMIVRSPIAASLA
jgi:hypothetical protein